MRVRGCAAGFVMTLLVVPIVSAQQAGPPPRGLFGSTDRSTLGASVSVYGGYDETVQHLRAGELRQDTEGDGSNAGISGSLALRHPIGRASLTGSASGDLRYYRAGRGATVTSATSSGNLAFGIPVGRRGAFSLAQGYSRSSSYRLNLLEGLDETTVSSLELATPDYRVARGRSDRYDTHASFSQTLGRRTGMSVDYGLGMLRFPAEQVHFASQGAGASIEHGFTPSFSLHLGYHYDRRFAENEADIGELHRLDIGPSFAKNLTVSARTSFAMSMGGSLATVRSGGATSTVPAIVGSLALQHRFGRSWAFAAQYHAQPQIVELYRNPVFSNTASLSLSGRPWRRLALALSGGASRMTFDAGRGDVANTSVFATMRPLITISRSVSAFVEYSFFMFDGSQPFVPAASLQRRIGRQAVRAGLSASWPLLTARR